jgi:hypothetical protein
MTPPNEYLQYAREALHSAERATNDDEREALESLASKWTQAAIATERLIHRIQKPDTA